MNSITHEKCEIIVNRVSCDLSYFLPLALSLPCFPSLAVKFIRSVFLAFLCHSPSISIQYHLQTDSHESNFIRILSHSHSKNLLSYPLLLQCESEFHCSWQRFFWDARLCLMNSHAISYQNIPNLIFIHHLTISEC